MNKETARLNAILKNNSPVVYSLLSTKGKEIYFPKNGILSQSQDAKDTIHNATIGVALLDDKTPMRLKSIENKIHIIPKRAFAYSSSYGNIELRTQWKKLILEKNPGITGTISTPIVSLALTGGLFTAAYLFVDEGDEIIMPDLYWENYELIFENFFGGKISTFSMFTKDAKFNMIGLKRSVEKSKKPIILLNFPHNPTGYTPTAEEAEEIKDILTTAAEKKPVLVICDDAYFGLVYEKGVYTESMFSKLYNTSKNLLCIKLDGATKEDYVWGFRVGFITYSIKSGECEVYSVLEDKTAGVIRGNISNAPNISQSLIFDGIISPDYKKEKQHNYDILKSRYEMVKLVLKDTRFKKFFSPLPYNSGYFMCIQLKNGLDAESVRKILIERYSTGVIASKNILRLAFSSLTQQEIPAVFDNILSACEYLSKNQ